MLETSLIIHVAITEIVVSNNWILYRCSLISGNCVIQKTDAVFGSHAQVQ